MSDKKVLIIDDDVNAVKFLSVVLEEGGIETLTANDGSEGWQIIQENAVDLIVLDVMMPKKTGFTLFKQLKRDEKLKDIPVLMLTGVAASLEELDSAAANTEERPFDCLRESLRHMIAAMREEGLVKPEMFVDKPIDPEAFMGRVRQLIGD
ncbi:response regulator [bacterium]|nr:response regulator [bacterium]MBU1073169.1 response regulator [bacterium]MBU1675417.1 response regulator [bacterium]